MSSSREQEESWEEIARISRIIDNISKCTCKEKGEKEKAGNKRKGTDRHILRQDEFKRHIAGGEVYFRRAQGHFCLRK